MPGICDEAACRFAKKVFLKIIPFEMIGQIAFDYSYYSL